MAGWPDLVIIGFQHVLFDLEVGKFILNGELFGDVIRWSWMV